MMSKVWIKKSVAPRMKERKRGSEREKKTQTERKKEREIESTYCM